MAANGGYRVFNTGDVLTAAQVQYYLQNQTVMYFATTTARDAVLTGATLVEGMVSYVPSTGLRVYNGTSWVAPGTLSPLTTKGDVWGFSTTDARIPVGTNGQVLTADSTNALGVSWQSAASSSVTWTGRKPSSSTTATVNSIAYNGTNLYVAGLNDGTMWTSPDGITWTSRTSGFGVNSISAIAYGNGTWVAVGGNGTITSSTDGITWTSRTSNLGTGLIRDVKYANSLWIAVGQNSTGPAIGVTTSTDGITWTFRSMAGTIGTVAYSVNYANGYWVLGANQGSTHNAAYSTNGTSWTVFATGSALATAFAIYVNGYWLLASGTSGGAIYYQASTPISTWNSGGAAALAPRNTGSNSISSYNNKVYWLDGGVAGPTIAGQITQQFINNATVSFTNSTKFDYLGTPIAVPLSSNDQNDISAFYISSSNGQMIIGDTSGRIYTSF